MTRVHKLCGKMKTFYLNILLVICLQTLCLAVPLRDGNFLYRSTAANGKTIICLSCPPGTYLVRNCTFPQTTGQCQICPISYFQPNYTNSPTCLACVTKCLHVDVRNRSEPSQAVCEPTKNVCSCKNSTCILDSECPPGKEPAILATSFQHTTCKECPEETYSDVYSSTEMCKPSTKCGPHKVAILNGDKTRDRVCIPRSGDFNNTWDMTTITAIMNNTRAVVPQRERNNVILILLIMCPALLITIPTLVLFIIISKRKNQNKSERKVQQCTRSTKEERRMASNSDILEIDEHANKCSNRRRRNETKNVFRTKSDECIELLTGTAQVHTNIHNIEGPSPQEETEESSERFENSHLLGSAVSLSTSSLKKETSSTPIKPTEDTKALDAPYKKSKVLPKTLEDPCPKTLDVWRENTKALPKPLDDPCEKVNALPKTLHLPSEETMTLPKHLDISYEQTKVLPCLHSPKRKKFYRQTGSGVKQSPTKDVFYSFQIQML